MKLLARIKLAARFVAQGPQARYEGATYNPIRSLLPSVVRSAREDITVWDRFRLIEKSRFFEKNNAIANRLADLFEQYTVGCEGIQFLPQSSDEAWNARALKYWNDWQRFADLSSRQPFSVLQGIISRGQFFDGEMFVLLTTGSTNKPRIQLIEGHRVRNPNNSGDKQDLVDGIRIDDRGRPLGYWVSVNDSLSSSEFVFQDAENIVHIFEPGRTGQFHGLPMLYPVINDLHDLDDLQTLEMEAAKNAAEVKEVIETSSGEMQTDDDLIRGTNVGSDGKSRADYYREVMGARARVLKNGDKYHQHGGERPSAATSGYWETLTKKICAGVGIPYEIAFPNSMQGTSMRSVLDMANAFFRVRSAAFAGQMGRIYEYVIKVGIANGDLSEAPADWYLWDYQTPRSINVDVGRNSAAMVSEWKAGMRTMQGTYAETGEDWRQALRQKAIEAKFVRDLAKEFGIDRAEIVLLDPNEISANAAAANAAADTKGQGGAA